MPSSPKSRSRESIAVARRLEFEKLVRAAVAGDTNAQQTINVMEFSYDEVVYLFSRIDVYVFVGPAGVVLNSNRWPPPAANLREALHNRAQEGEWAAQRCLAYLAQRRITEPEFTIAYR